MDVSTSSSSDLVELSVKVQGKDGWSGVVPVSLQSTAGELKALIAPLASVAPDGMRLLAAGRCVAIAPFCAQVAAESALILGRRADGWWTTSSSPTKRSRPRAS